MKRYTDEWWQGVKDFNNSFPINIFKRDKEMTANELADKLENNITSWGDCTHEQHDNDKYFKEQAATMLRQQQAEIESLQKELQKIKIWCGKTQFVHDYSSPFIELQKASEK